MSGSGFGHFRYAANEFYSKIFFTVYSRLLNLQYKFTVQRVIEASFFEVTTIRSCEAVNKFHNVTFSPGGKAIISISVIFLVSTFESFLGFRKFFPRLSAIFLSGRGNLKENYVTLFTKFDWSVISSSRSKYGTFENE